MSFPVNNNSIINEKDDFIYIKNKDYEQVDSNRGSTTKSLRRSILKSPKKRRKRNHSVSLLQNDRSNEEERSDF